MLSLFLGIVFLIENIISVSTYVGITILNLLELSVTVMCLIVHTDVITTYDIINFNIEFFIG